MNQMNLILWRDNIVKVKYVICESAWRWFNEA